ncbi:MAG: hypothetical protein V3V34_11750 [Kiloniellales bacterium]
MEWAIAYDEDARELWGFGGFNVTTFAVFNDLWRYRIDKPEEGWRQVFAVGTLPAARSDHLWVWDPVRKGFWLVGGVDVGFTFLVDTWFFDPATLAWTLKTPTGAPLPRFPTTGVYDRARNLVVKFGGVTTGFTPQQDTEEYDPATDTWAAASPATPPPVRFLHAMAYDEERGVTVLHGGGDGVGGERGDTWEYPVAGDWLQRLTAASPAARRLHAMAYHPRRKEVILTMGTVSAGPFLDQWALSAEDWHELFSAVLPSGRDNVTGLSSRVDGLNTVVVHGGQDQISGPQKHLVDTQSLDREGEWSRAQIGLDFDRAAIAVGPAGATLVDPATTAEGLITDLHGISASAITGFAMTADLPANTRILLSFVVGGQSKWWDGAAWADSDDTAAQMNTAAEVAANIATLALGTRSIVQPRARLISDTPPANPTLRQLKMTFDAVARPVTEPRRVLITGHIEDEGGGDLAGARLEVAPPDGGFYHGDTLIGRAFAAKSDAQGDLSLEVFETETVSQLMTITLELGSPDNTRTVTAQIPDQDAVDLKDLLP